MAVSGTKATALCRVFFFVFFSFVPLRFYCSTNGGDRERELEKKIAVLFIVVPFVFHQRFAGALGHGEAGVDIPAVSGAKAVSRPRTRRRVSSQDHCGDGGTHVH